MNTTVKLAVASALGMVGVAGTASAAYFEPETFTTANTILRISGATAQDKGLILLMQRMCLTNTMVRVQGTIDSAILCEANGVDTPGIAVNNKILLHKNSNGGSSRGVNPVADQTTNLVTFLNLSTNAAVYTNCATSIVSGATTDFVEYKQYLCGTHIAQTTGIAPDAGISDVEPPLLGWVAGVNGAFGAGYPASGPALLFGVPVSKNFRDALQAAQAAKIPGCVGVDTEACMPSLTKAQITNMYNGGLIPINRLSTDAGVVLPPPSTTNPNISVCRRKAGSGTLASYNAYFLNDGCAKGVRAMSAGVDGNLAIPSVAARVNEYSATPQVIGCLNANHAVGKYAIGMSSMESVVGNAYAGTGLAAPFDTDTSNWGWAKIQGYAPSLLNTAQTKYDFAMEVSYQGKNGLADAAPNFRKTLFDLVISTNSTALVIRELNTQFIHASGTVQSGFLGRPSSGSSTLPSAAPAGVLTAGEVTSNPVNTWTRAPLGTPNSCQPPGLSRETGLDMLQ